jgi:hypothetical protein
VFFRKSLQKCGFNTLIKHEPKGLRLRVKSK